ncbi:hypothetical protein V5O48_002787 [Marasmius crinis-equi]|uniref:Uncharacterized protein n=1 Tax=Marasmius crinis-equi TaxID=585013 RepID=A0ABR3FUP2_9AGAR
MVVSDGENDIPRKGKGKKPRSLLRRKTSINRSTSPSSPPPHNTTTFKSVLVSSPLPYTPSFSPSTSMNPFEMSPATKLHSQTLLPPKHHSRLKSPSPSRGSSSRSSSQSRRVTPSKNDTTNITPAEEVMLAYKKQMEREHSIERRFQEAERKAEEARRLSDERQAAVKSLRGRELERGRSQTEMTQGGPIALARDTVPDTPHDGIDITPPSTPYYTVYRSASDYDGIGYTDGESQPVLRHRSASVTVGIPKPSDADSRGFRKSLGRKFSFKWRSSTSSKYDNVIASMPNLEAHRELHGGKLAEGSSSRQNTSPGVPNSSRSPLDKSLLQPSTPSRVPSHRPNNVGTDERTSPRPLAVMGSPTPSSPSTPSPGGSGGGGTFRNALRRLSANGLRDRYKSRSQDFSNAEYSPDTKPPPPVPALPKGVVSMMKSGSTLKPSGSGSAPQTPYTGTDYQTTYPESSPTTRRPRNSSSAPPNGPPVTSSSSSMTTRPSMSTATRSSSPDRFFGPARSSRSSLSSYGHEIPPLPTNIRLDIPSLPSHIFSPSELAAIQRPTGDGNVLDSRAYSSQRQTDEYRSDSPTIPEFSTAAAINTFAKKPATPNRRPSTSAGTSRSHASLGLPIPPRNTRRPSTSQSVKTSPVSSSPIYPKSSKAQSDDGHGSTSVHSLPPGRKSTSFIRRASKSYNASSFRDYPTSLTATEERWESLLSRSDKAGGTLHIHGTGTDRLESDSLRFSAADPDLPI